MTESKILTVEEINEHFRRLLAVEYHTVAETIEPILETISSLRAENERLRAEATAYRADVEKVLRLAVKFRGVRGHGPIAIEALDEMMDAVAASTECQRIRES